VRRVALTLRADAVEAVLDRLMPLVPQGVYERPIDPERTEVAFFGDGLPAAAELDALAGDALLGREEEEVPDSREERRRRAGRAWTVAGRLRVRSPDDPPSSTDGALEVVIEPAPGAFGTGAHPTTRGCLELLLELEPGGGLADLGCGSGVVAIAAARLGWEPVYGLDFDERSVEATGRNAQRNGVQVRAVLVDLREIPAPPAHTLVANIPLDIHERVAETLSPATARVVVSGITASQQPAATAAYARAGLVPQGQRVGGGWATLLLGRP
jgi:ribosomal protein L11 methyltransferase